MSTAQTNSGAGVESAAEAPVFYCAEVWGGNRPIDSAFELPGIRGWVFSRPANGGRGGDIHYISLCGSGLLSRLCVADVAGHGERVAAVSQKIHVLLRRYMDSLDERRVLVGLNRRIVTSNLSTLTTAAAISYFPPLRRLSISYAGHPPAWLYRSAEDKWLQLLPPSRAVDGRRLVDLPLAIDAGTSFSRRKEHVRPGDRMVLVTDGVLEAPDSAGALFGDERLERVLTAHRHAQARELARAVVAAVAAQTGRAEFSHDDVTVMVVEFVPGPRAFGLWHMLKRRLLGRPREALAATV